MHDVGGRANVTMTSKDNKTLSRLSLSINSNTCTTAAVAVLV